jgi:hypothetical protein
MAIDACSGLLGNPQNLRPWPVLCPQVSLDNRPPDRYFEVASHSSAGGWEGAALGGVFVLAAGAGVMTMLLASRLSRQVGSAKSVVQPVATQPVEALP